MEPPRPSPTARRDGLVAALLADLRDVVVDLAAGAYTPTTLAMLERNLRRVVPSALGVTVVLARSAGADEEPAEVNLVARTLQPPEIHAALRVPISALSSTVDGSVTFYAGEPAAFVDVADDLTKTLHTSSAVLDQCPPLPDTPTTRSLTRLTDLSLVNRALGHLLDRGRTLSEARAELVRRAEQTQTDLVGAARSLLELSH